MPRVHASIAHVGLLMASPAPDLFMPTRGLPELGHPFGFFDYKPLAAAFERRGGGECGGDAVTLCLPLILRDQPNRLSERGCSLADRGALLRDGRGAHHLAPGDVICSSGRGPTLRPTAALPL